MSPAVPDRSPDRSPAPPARATSATRRGRRLGRRVLYGLVGSLLALAVVGALAMQRLAAAEHARAWVAHTHAVLDALTALAEADVAGATHVRSYVLGREIRHLAPLAGADRAAHAAVDEIARLTQDNPVQQGRVPELRHRVEAHFAGLHAAARGVAPRAAGGLGPPALVATTPAGSLDALVARMRQTERDLLVQREAVEAAATRRARLELGVGVFGGCAVGIAALALLWADAGRRRRVEGERDQLIVGLQDAHEELEAQNEELVAQSEELVVQSEQLMRQSDELQGARDYLEAVLDHMADGVIAFDERGTVLICNPAAQLLLGLPHGAAPVADWADYTHWYDADGGTRLADADVPVTRVRHGGTVRGLELVVAHDGARQAARPQQAGEGPRRRTVSVAGRPVRDRTGRYRGAILVLHDITDRKAAERLKNELVSVVSHELRTPLTSIRGALGLLEGGAYGGLPDPIKRLVSIGRSNTDRLIRLVNDLLDLEKLQAGRLELRREPVPVAAIVAPSAEGVRSFAAEHGVRVEVHEDPTAGAIDQLVVRGDADRLTQVLTNLLSNAIKFSPAGAAVTLGVARPAPGVVRLSVRDAGPGIAEHDLPRLFQRFQQLDGSDTRRHGGTGLGLAITKDLVEQHGGTIGVVSQLGEGALFWVELPCTTPCATVGAAGRGAAPRAAVPGGAAVEVESAVPAADTPASDPSCRTPAVLVAP